MNHHLVDAKKTNIRLYTSASQHNRRTLLYPPPQWQTHLPIVDIPFIKDFLHDLKRDLLFAGYLCVCGLDTLNSLRQQHCLRLEARSHGSEACLSQGKIEAGYAHQIALLDGAAKIALNLDQQGARSTSLGHFLGHLLHLDLLVLVEAALLTVQRHVTCG